MVLVKLLKEGVETSSWRLRSPSSGTFLSSYLFVLVLISRNRGAIKMTEVDLATARSHVEQFKDISQASEAAFEKVNEAYLDYRRTAEAQLSQREVCP
jgi:hypothetical protein